MKSDTCFSRFLLDNHPELHGFASRSEATGLVIIKKKLLRFAVLRVLRSATILFKALFQ